MKRQIELGISKGKFRVGGKKAVTKEKEKKRANKIRNR